MNGTLNPFVEVERMVNKGAATVLANAVATFNGGEPFSVLFDRERTDPLGLVETSAPTVGFSLSLAPGLKHDDLLVIDGVPHRVAGGLEPDSSGWVDVQLRLD